MAEPFRNYTLISMVLFIYTLLIAAPYALYRQLPPPSLVWTLTGIGVLFGVVLYIIIWLHDDQNRKKLAAREESLAGAERSKVDEEHGHDEVLAKKLFEINVINASLNREIAERMQAETESRELQKKMPGSTEGESRIIHLPGQKDE